MRRPRDHSLLWKLQRRAALRLRALWSQRPRRASPEHVELADVRVRLEHYLRAIYGRTVRIEAVGGARGGGMRRTLGNRFRAAAASTSESGAVVIRLPASLAPSLDRMAAFEQYRCLAIEHAERIARGSAVHAAALGSDLERDLFELAEAVSVDAAIARSQPGMAHAFAAGRAHAARARVARSGATELEHRVERLARDAFTPSGEGHQRPVPITELATGSAEWARRTASALAGDAGDRALAGYRRIAPLGLWGTSIAAAALPRGASPGDATTAADAAARRHRPSRRLPSVGTPDMVVARVQPAVDGEGDAGQPLAGVQPSPGAPPTDDPAGVAVDEPAADEAIAAPGAARMERGARPAPDVPLGAEYRYPEWDAYARAYHREESLVRVATPTLAARAPEHILAAPDAVLVRQVRERFAHLRAHRQRLHRQPNGEEVDLDAWVSAAADLAAGQSLDDRFYATVRVTRRALAIVLLIDTSASTRAQVNASHRVIDVERVAALLAAEAFDALGDPYGILAFGSDGRADVRITEIKRFAERNGALTERRLAALRPFNATRLGAALRHATAELASRPEAHRLLLVLSDGRPNDRDGYVDEDYAVEDSRRAVTEARAAGVTPYCITIDPEEPQEYIGHIFGENGYRALAETTHLPDVLLRAVQGLVRR